MESSVGLREYLEAQRRDRSLFDEARHYAGAYMEEVGHRAVWPSAEALDALEGFEEPLPEEPGDPHAMLRRLHDVGSPATVAQTGGRYFGFVNGNAVPGALAAKWLVDVWDQNAALHVISPVASRLEALGERWLVDLLGLPEGSAAGFVGGTSVATLCGLAAGREVLLARRGWDVGSRGLFGAPELRVVVGEHAHATVFKALAILGLGRDRVIRVPGDDQGRLRAEALPELDDATLVVCQAGNVNTGAFDPFDAIVSRAREAGAWVHVDGAFGLWAAASRRYRPLTAGMVGADSWSADAHKTLNAPYDCGIVFCRRREALSAALRASGAYIVSGERRDGMDFTPDMSRRARGVELWATLKILGRRGVETLVEELCARAALFAELFRSAGFRVRNDVVFNQVLVACDAPEETEAVLKGVQASGECWCGPSRWGGEPVIRISVCSWATGDDDVRRSVRAFVRVRDAVRKTTEGRRGVSSPAEEQGGVAGAGGFRPAVEGA